LSLSVDFIAKLMSLYLNLPKFSFLVDNLDVPISPYVSYHLWSYQVLSLYQYLSFIKVAIFFVRL